MREINISSKVKDVKVGHEGNNLVSKNLSKSTNTRISAVISVLLLEKMKNILESNKIGGVYKYITISEIIRSALEAYKNGMELISLTEKGEKKVISLLLPSELKEFHSSLRAKNEILERAIHTFITYKI